MCVRTRAILTPSRRVLYVPLYRRRCHVHPQIERYSIGYLFATRLVQVPLGSLNGLA